MYTQHFQLSAKPFQICTDPKFLWFGPQHKEALAGLLHGVRGNKGVIALSGGVGTGKTTLINALMELIKDDVIAAVVTDPGMQPIEFFNYIANLYKITNRINCRADFLSQFDVFLKDAHQQKKRVLLVIDEAQRLSADLLEEIRLLSRIEQSGQRLLNIFLVGQNELNTMLLKPENRDLKQRIATNYNIAPLTLDDVHAYIGHRLKVAGCERQIFTRGAINRVFAFSNGYPRLINTICDQSLISAYADHKHKVTAKMVESSATDFQIPGQTQSKQTITCEIVYPTTKEALSPPPVPAKRPYGKKQNRPTNQNMFNRFRLTYIGSALALFFFSGVLIHQYTMGPPPENVQTRQTPYSQASALQMPARIDAQQFKNKATRSQRTTVQYPTRQEEPTAPNVANDAQQIMDESNWKSSVITGSVVMPTESRPEVRSAKPETPSPASAVDKDPGAIIDWLIRVKTRNP